MSLAKIEEATLELSKEKWTTQKSEEDIYSKFGPLFGLISEAEKYWEEENKPKGKAKVENPEEVKAAQEYFSYLKLQKVYERNNAVLSLWNEWDQQASEKKKQPDDFVKVYDIIIQTCTEMLPLLDATNQSDTLHKEASAKVQYYKGVRYSFLQYLLKPH
jgi:hypothetical protein